MEAARLAARYTQARRTWLFERFHTAASIKPGVMNSGSHDTAIANIKLAVPKAAHPKCTRAREVALMNATSAMNVPSMATCSGITRCPYLAVTGITRNAKAQKRPASGPAVAFANAYSAAA